VTGERLYTATDYFIPFPQPEDVFATRVDEHAEYLLPLASVNLRHLSPDWKGWIHFVTPIEPYEGVVGEGTHAYHTYLCRENWVGYRITGGKYELAADFRFFQQASFRAHRSPGAPPEKPQLDLAVHYADAKTGYGLKRTHFREHGFVHNPWAKPGWFGGFKKSDRVELVSDLGGPCADGNWSNMENFPLTPLGEAVDAEGERHTEVFPLTEDGRPFAYIGSLPIYHYIAETPDFTSLLGGSLLLFYDPGTNVALTTFDWS
jgi:hypothetical protein